MKGFLLQKKRNFGQIPNISSTFRRSRRALALDVASFFWRPYALLVEIVAKTRTIGNLEFIFGTRRNSEFVLWNFGEIPAKFRWNSMNFERNFVKICEISVKMWKKEARFLLKFWIRSGAKEWKSCRSRKMLKNAPTLAIGGVDTEENEHCKVCPLSVYRSPGPLCLSRST